MLLLKPPHIQSNVLRLTVVVTLLVLEYKIQLSDLVKLIAMAMIDVWLHLQFSVGGNKTSPSGTKC